MKAHIGADADSELVHTVTATAANLADVAEVVNLLRSNETKVFGDANHTGVERRAHASRGKWWIADKRGAIKAIDDPRKRKRSDQREMSPFWVKITCQRPLRFAQISTKRARITNGLPWSNPLASTIPPRTAPFDQTLRTCLLMAT